MRIVTGVIASVLLLGGAGSAGAQEVSTVPVTTTVIDQSDGGADWPTPRRVETRSVLATKVGHGCLATMPDEIERVALADDSIARVQIISPRELLLTGLRPGETTLHVWLSDGRRLRYLFRTERDMDLLHKTLKDLDPRIHAESSSDSAAIVLRGEVADRETAREAGARAAAVLSSSGGGQIMNLLRYPGAAFSVEDELQSLLADIDSRIEVRRIQVGEQPDVGADTFVLEGTVRNLEDLVRAVMLAERQLGGTGGRVRAANQDDRLDADQFRRGFFGGAGGAFGGSGGGGGALGAGAGISGSDPRSNSLAAQVARGQVITSESGRVVSLLEVEDLHQVMVSIRVMEVDRVKARQAGISFRVDADDISIGNYTGPNVSSLPGAGSPPSVSGLSSGLGNIVGAWVDQTQAIVTAIDFLQEKNFARSVAEPNVLTLSGELATIVVGGEVPIPSTAATSVSTFQGFAFQNFGVRLDIRPTVTGDDMVALEVAPSISRPTGGGSIGGVPAFTVQSVTTTARVQAGQSLLLGGLLSFDEGLEDRRIPGLGKIPLFRWKRKTRSDRELLFLITPRLVKIERELRADAVVDPTPDLSELRLPDLRWPDDREHWRDEFEPIPLPADGIPESFRVEPTGWDEEFSDSIADEYAAGDYDSGQITVTDVGAVADPYAIPEPESESAEAAAEPALPVAMKVASWVSHCLYLRPTPDVWGRPLDCLKTGSPVTMIGAENGWKHVRLEDGRLGWMAGQFLEPVSN